MKRCTLLWIGLAVVLGINAPVAAMQEDAGDELLEEITTADPGELGQLLKKHAAAKSSEDAAVLTRVLREMAAHDNPELLAPALDALRYRATKVDKKAARAEADEFGLTSKKELKQTLLDRVAAVQAAAAQLAANFPGDKKAASALLKAFKDKSIRKDRPTAFAAVIGALGQIGNRKIEKDVFKRFRLGGQPDVMRASVRYFGQIKTREMSIVRKLCEELAAPEPASADSPSNPPASYWEERWKTWNAIRRDVSWALKEITGQVFRPAEGEKPGDSKKALDYVKEHKRELGLK